MAVITIDKKTFEKEIGNLDSEMQNKIAMFGTPVEAVDSNELQLEVFPNRPDLLSYHGFRRAFLAFLGKKTGLKKYKINKPEKNYNVSIESSLKNVRPYTACAIVKGLKLDDEKIKELIEIQEKLHITIGRKRKKVAIGIYPLEEIKLPITFKAMEPDKIKFIPLEMNREISGLEILQKHPTGREYSHLLAGKAKFPIFTDAENKILSMPPIINSQSTGKVNEKTKEVFVECSGFDFETLKRCLNIIITSMAEMGGKIYQMNLNYGSKKETTPNLTPQNKKISLEKTNKLLGLDLKEKDLKKLIERMGYNYNQKENSVEIPVWRTDILHEVDIIEDIAIAYGYENLIPEIPSISTTGEEDRKETMKRKISEILSGLRMNEVSNYHISTKKDQVEKMEFSKQEETIIVEASKTENDTLRKNLSSMLLKNLSENIDSEYPQEIFEIGKVFYLKEGNVKEKNNLAAVVSPGNFTRINQILDYLSRMTSKKLTLKEPEKTEKTPPYFIEGRTAEIFLNEKNIGFIGEVHPKILKNWKIKMPVALFEIELEDILEELTKKN
ncbi:MAG: phenylalanine--tRNA ligase subunit beta [Candidatus Pacearchaeota archaeon]